MIRGDVNSRLLGEYLPGALLGRARLREDEDVHREKVKEGNDERDRHCCNPRVFLYVPRCTTGDRYCSDESRMGTYCLLTFLVAYSVHFSRAISIAIISNILIFYEMFLDGVLVIPSKKTISR